VLKEIFIEQQRSVSHFFEKLDAAEAEAVFQACLECPGIVVLTGVGKSGIIAEKIAATMISTGTRAICLPPTNFLHGDIGILGEKDLLIMISKSGETEELLALVPFVKRRGTKLIGWVSNPNSRLARECDLSLLLPVDQELCPYDLAPTTSTAVQLLFGDALSVALMKARQFTLSDFMKNHPLGSIGEKIKQAMQVDEVMFKNENIPLCGEEKKVREILEELSSKRCGCMIVTSREGRLQGVFTDGDLRRALQRHGTGTLEQAVGSVMTRTPTFVKRGILAYDAIKTMQRDPKRWITVLPVLDDEERVVGVVRMHDIINAGINAGHE
jgi:arabinose-5-phosphate isomerase